MNSFGSRSTLRAAGHDYEIYRIDALDKQGISTKHLPFSLRILLENLLRTEDGRSVTKEDIRALAAWNSRSKAGQGNRLHPQPRLDAGLHRCARRCRPRRHARCHEAAFRRSALINPLQPAELVIDHSVQVDEFGTPQAFQLNAELEFLRNKERYGFFRWGQTAFPQSCDCSARYRDRASGQS